MGDSPRHQGRDERATAERGVFADPVHGLLVVYDALPHPERAVAWSRVLARMDDNGFDLEGEGSFPLASRDKGAVIVALIPAEISDVPECVRHFRSVLADQYHPGDPDAPTLP